ncbi:hypothetical protein VY88_20935 [Azospirillum thiophilum]|uniref:Uncharacterized protein n=1 Tax=Azospirillum thiophilum TaxID=528244 RepID=A0AAC8W365_9PROT|nr:hypothetical protein AL072_25035 [Azospirillum thiophilum]KJR63894.1 hypothetical protein VY88_20935 [Azospirillum thiophilum]
MSVQRNIELSVFRPLRSAQKFHWPTAMPRCARMLPARIRKSEDVVSALGWQQLHEVETAKLKLVVTLMLFG